MKRQRYAGILLIFGMFFALVVSHIPLIYTLLYHSINEVSTAENGSIRLFNLSDGEQAVLDGEWEFYWNCFLVTQPQQEVVPDLLIHVPDYWSKYKIKGDYLPSHGYASYRLKLEGLQTTRPVTIYIPDFGSAYRVFFDGTLTARSGVVSKNPTEIFTTTKVSLTPVTLIANNMHEVVIEVATTRFSGLYMTPVIFEYESAVHDSNVRNNLRFLLFGTALFSFFILVVGYILSFQTVKRSIWLPIIGIFVLLRIMLTTEFYSFWQNTLFFGLSYETSNPLMFLLSFAFKYLLIFLIQELLGISFSKKEKLGLLLYYVALYLLYLFVPHGFYNRHLTILIPVCTFLMEIYSFFKIYIHRQQMKKYGLLVYWGAVLAITGLIMDSYYINGNVYWNLSLSLLALFTGYLMILSLVTSIQVADISREFAISSVLLASAKEQIAMQTEYYDALSTQINEVRAIRHDFRHFVSVMEHLSDEGQYEELRRFLSKYAVKVDTDPLPVFCENVVANSILGSYSLQLKEQEIHFYCTCQIPKELSISDTDLCVVLGNALENAMEACKKLDNPLERFVSIEAGMINSQLLIKIVNSYNGTVQRVDGRYITSKEMLGHGFGLQNIQKVVNTCGGYIKMDHSEKVFTLMAAFPESYADDGL